MSESVSRIHPHEVHLILAHDHLLSIQRRNVIQLLHDRILLHHELHLLIFLLFIILRVIGLAAVFVLPL